MGMSYIPERQETRDWSDHSLQRYLREIGHEILLIPNSANLLDSIPLLSELDGFVLSGGNDLGEFSLRDSTETEISDFALSRGLPVLGICRGAQLLATYFSGEVLAVSGHSGRVHHIRSTGMASGPSRKVLSHHNFAVNLSPAANVLVTADDGTPEAFTFSGGRFLGLMWHPERQADRLRDNSDHLAINKFFNSRDLILGQDFF